MQSYLHLVQSKTRTKTAGYFILDEEQTYMIGSDETTILLKNGLMPIIKRYGTILSMEKDDIKIELPDDRRLMVKKNILKFLNHHFA